MEADWGWDQPPHPLAEEYQGHSPLQPDQLPDVQRLSTDGWELLPDAPVYVFLPCVWPRSARTWLPDRSTRYAKEWTAPADGGRPVQRRVPWSPEMYEQWEADANQNLVQVGLPPRPAGRLWLLRPVGGFPSLQALLRHLWGRADAAGVPKRLIPEFVQLLLGELRSLAAQE